MKINYSKHIALVTVAILGVASLAAGAQADEASPGVNSRTVHYADLNLDTAAGAMVLYQRIRGAAEKVCGDTASRQLDRRVVVKACMDQAIVASVRAVNREQLNRTANAQGYEVAGRFEVASIR